MSPFFSIVHTDEDPPPMPPSENQILDDFRGSFVDFGIIAIEWVLAAILLWFANRMPIGGVEATLLSILGIAFLVISMIQLIADRLFDIVLHLAPKLRKVIEEVKVTREALQNQDVAEDTVLQKARPSLVGRGEETPFVHISHDKKRTPIPLEQQYESD